MKLPIFLLLLATSVFADEAAPMKETPPSSVFMVAQCDQVIVMWIQLQNGDVYRADAEHHPEDENEYVSLLKWAKTARYKDVYSIPCPDRAGGKDHKKEQS
jgi:hypothetical protein